MFNISKYASVKHQTEEPINVSSTNQSYFKQNFNLCPKSMRKLNPNVIFV